MAELRIEIEGQVGNVSVSTLLTVFNESHEVLKELDSTLSQHPEGSLDWVVSDLGIGSLDMALETRSKLEDANFGPSVKAAFADSFYRIESGIGRPPYLSDTAMRRIERVLSTIGRDGATGLVLSYVDTRVQVTAHSLVNVKQLLRVRHRSIASIEGRLLTLSVRGEPHFMVQDEHLQRSVTCKFGDDKLILGIAKEALGMRVNVSGLLSYNVKGEPLGMRVERLRVLRERSALPTIGELEGSDPDYTGTMSTEEYLRSIRLG